ncbi:hypothetical protein NPIL_223291 [Nephila pilipes]|uniref:Uncharacterized protein n=1 Tax=Nephila pilipes TaxID=299642 RepID=A0A8X6MGC5_NEPPI|nr:hypothetical protein NPIL_223291 [Nephila pilipes]
MTTETGLPQLPSAWRPEVRETSCSDTFSTWPYLQSSWQRNGDESIDGSGWGGLWEEFDESRERKGGRGGRERMKD